MSKALDTLISEYPGISFNFEHSYTRDATVVRMTCKHTGIRYQAEIDNYFAREDNGGDKYTINLVRRGIREMGDLIVKTPPKNQPNYYMDEFDFYSKDSIGYLPGDKEFKSKKKEQPIESEHAGIF